MLSESVLSVRKELFPQNKTAVSDMTKVNIQKKNKNFYLFGKNESSSPSKKFYKEISFHTNYLFQEVEIIRL